MVNYQSLSIVQFLFILLCGISVLDYGIWYDDAQKSASDSDGDKASGLGFNELIFGDDAYTGFFVGHQVPDNKFWGVIQFWGYCMIIVAILQLLKALSVENL